MEFHVVTLFPHALDSYLGESILKRAIEDKKLKVSFYNPRDFANNKWSRIDRPPYAGGPGMVIQAEPVIKAIEASLKKIKQKNKNEKYKIIFLSPSGKQFTNEYAKKVVRTYKHVVIVSGRYEGIDARVKKVFKMEDVSIGPFVLTGGELPAEILIDVISRQVPGILGNFDSLEESRTASPEVYTRPEVFKYKGKSYKVPGVLLTGNRAKIQAWKEKKAGK
jgi:tRNA (guanine37-N1)-methyltransferase